MIFMDSFRTAKLSLVICTYNRSELLGLCLESLTKQTVASSQFEVIVVNNNSTDNTEKVAKGFSESFINYRVVMELTQGLSVARNRGYKEAEADWVLYLDDDAKAHTNLVERALWLIKNHNFDCFGGRFNAWYRGEKPKWIPDEFGTNYELKDFGRLDVLNNGGRCACGGIFAVKKKVLEELNGFSAEYGMSGDSLGYGEETQLQYLMSCKGYLIGFDPKLQVDHLVGRKKYSIFWHLRNGYVVGRYIAKLNNETKVLRLFFEMLRLSCKNIFGSTKKIICQRDYYWQNFLYDVLGPVFERFGKISTILTNKMK